MRKKKFLAILVSVFLLGSLLSGCGNGASKDTGVNGTGEETTGTLSGSSDTAETNADPGNGEVVTLSYLSQSLVEDPDGKVEQELIDEFMQLHPNIKIETEGISGNDIFSKIVTLATADDVPDIFSNAFQYMTSYNDMGIIEPLNDLLGEDYMTGFVEGALPECTDADGNMLYIPWSAIPNAIIYRSDIIADKGLELPKTWDEFTEFVKALTEDTNKDGTVDRYGLALIASANSSAASRFIPMLRNSGGMDLELNADGVYSTNMDPGAVTMLNYFYEWCNVDKVVPIGAGDIDHAAAINLLATDKAVCTISGPHTIGSIVAQNPDMEGKFAGAPLPTADGSASQTSAGIYGFSISSNCKNKEAAAEFLKFMLEPDNFLKFHKKTYN